MILAVDGGDSKADVVLVDVDGRLIGATRRAGSAHFGLGHNGSPIETVDQAIRIACSDGGLDLDRRPVANTAVYCVAGADIPIDDRRIAAELGALGWAGRTFVRNDTFAMLRAGTERGWGVAVVCGSGLNCAGVGPDGKVVRFPSFGELSGDRAAGGGWLGRAALGAAIRARDGRGPRTVLERLAPGQFGLSSPTALMEAIYVGRLDERRLRDLAPLVFKAAAAGDHVARALIDELADEIVATANAAIRRLRITTREVEVILGGGVFKSNDENLFGRIERGIRAVAGKAVMRKLQAPPVLGAALIALDEINATGVAKSRLRVELTDARMSRGPAAKGKTKSRRSSGYQ